MVVQPALEPLRRWDPERIGPYVLLGRLGAGAMGQVFLGRSTAGRLVAVKTIKIEFAEEAGFRARFAHEVAAARRVSGVFTAAVVAADADADVPWLATAYVPAPSLTELVRTCGPLPVAATRWLAAGCAEALESIHVAGLVHRDLKPSNVLVSPDGPRVIDFGVARAAERIQLTVTRGAVGTPAYMAPEQARDTRQASAASDMFSLGATLLYAATGHAPYQGETVMDVLVRLATEPPDLAGLPGELTDLVTSCLERSPRKRPSSAGLLSQLGPFVAGPAAHNGHHAYLTAQAMALIGDYQHGPQLAAQAPAWDATEGGTEGGGAAEDATFGSRTALSAPRGPVLRRWLARRRAAALPGRPAAAPRRPGSPAGLARKRRRGTVLGLAGRTGAAAALVAAGVLIAVALDGGIGEPSPAVSNNPATLPLRAAAQLAHSAIRQESRDRDAPAGRRRGHRLRGARRRLAAAEHGHADAGRPERPGGGRRRGSLQLHDRPGACVLSRADTRGPLRCRGHRSGRAPAQHVLPGPVSPRRVLPAPDRCGGHSRCLPLAARRHRRPGGSLPQASTVSRPWTTTGPPGGSTTPGRSACPGPPR